MIEQTQLKPIKKNSKTSAAVATEVDLSDGADQVEIAIEATRFDAWYGDFQALADISMKVQQNRITALIGPSGCGKSTFLRWINRMNDLIPGARASGGLELYGQDILDKGLDTVEHRRKVGMVFQKPNPFPKSIYENVLFGPKLHRRLSKTDRDSLVERSLRQAALWEEVKDRLKKSALALSGGQQQRLCIARAIAGRPTPRNPGIQKLVTGWPVRQPQEKESGSIHSCS